MSLPIYDASGDIVRWADEPEKGRLRFGVMQDCEPIIEENKRLQTLNDGYSPSRSIRRKASIPLGLIQTWLMEDGLSPVSFWQWPKAEQQAYLRRRYQSSDWRNLRTVA